MGSSGNCGGNIGANSGVGGCLQLITIPPTGPPVNKPTPQPTLMPMSPPAPLPTMPKPTMPKPTVSPPTSSPVSGPNISVYVVIKTDNYPTETSFKVTNQNGSEVMSGGGYTKQLIEYTATKTLPGSNNIYQFTIYDTYGDGLCCVHGQGGYNLFVDGKLAKAGGIFTKSETTTFQAVPGPTTAPSKPPLPLPTTSPVVGSNISVYIIIKTDNYPAETSFKVLNQYGTEVMAGGG